MADTAVDGSPLSDSVEVVEQYQEYCPDNQEGLDPSEIGYPPESHVSLGASAMAPPQPDGGVGNPDKGEVPGQADASLAAETPLPAVAAGANPAESAVDNDAGAGDSRVDKSHESAKPADSAVVGSAKPADSAVESHGGANPGVGSARASEPGMPSTGGPVAPASEAPRAGQPSQANLVAMQQQRATMQEQERVDWTTHKKEGMRLKRLMEESQDGAARFPHMAQLWNGSKEDLG